MNKTKSNGSTLVTYLRDLVVGVVTAILGPSLALSYFYERNALQLSSIEPLVTVLAVTSVVGSILVLGASFFGNARVVGVVTGVAGFGFWSMSWLQTDVLTSVVAWLVVTLITSFVLWWVARDFGWHVLVIFITGGIAVFFGVSGKNLAASANNLGAASAGGSAIIDLPNPQNVYFFVTDGFGRFDVLEDVLSKQRWSADPAQKIFSSHGFVIDEDATANYAETSFSIPSMLNASLDVTTSDSALASERARGLKTLSGRNDTVTWFQSRNYEYWHAGSGLFDASECDADIADVCFSIAEGNEAFRALWDLSPLRGTLGTSSETNTTERLTVGELGDWLATSVDPATPRLVFAHLIDPHAPYSHECAKRKQVTATDFGTLSEGWEPHHKKLYAAQVDCLVEDFDSALSAIITADPEAIIIIQADHGPAFDISWMSLSGWTTEDVWQRFGVFKATRMPERCYSDDSRASAMVNTIPIVEACLEGVTPELVDSKSYLTRYEENTVEEIKNTVDGVLPVLE